MASVIHERLIGADTTSRLTIKADNRAGRTKEPFSPGPLGDTPVKTAASCSLVADPVTAPKPGQQSIPLVQKISHI